MKNSELTLGEIAHYSEIKLVEVAIEMIIKEYAQANQMNDRFNSAHEGLAVIHEEFDELKIEVWKNEQSRDYDAMLQESIQVAAMGMKFAVDVCLRRKYD